MGFNQTERFKNIFSNIGKVVANQSFVEENSYPSVDLKYMYLKKFLELLSSTPRLTPRLSGLISFLNLTTYRTCNDCQRRNC